MNLKLRAWSPIDQKMIAPAALNDLLKAAYITGYTSYDEQLIYMLSTGLVDKLGQEIFEGDILKLRFHEAPHGYTYEFGVIKWHPECAAFKWYSGDKSDLNNYWLSESDVEYREAVGNIYQNPSIVF